MLETNLMLAPRSFDTRVIKGEVPRALLMVVGGNEFFGRPLVIQVSSVVIEGPRAPVLMVVGENDFQMMVSHTLVAMKREIAEPRP